ncbi:MAG: DnaJ domain-containing protein [Pseudanabaenaceae cyanobacterium SKYGB_i_bin29]|nr:DnaJ domain-containing protein [Pseudanabaenaceae cyanobacterium SKYG29]MDW8422679.1 DnaJ domain-containing protein [Pseudanabaenaceae cyanobacterium SKYGB_i_bin29]
MVQLPQQLKINRGLAKYQVTDHYAVLGAPLTAEPEEIRSCFLVIAKTLHPDTFQGSDRERLLATMLFARLISPAYQLLTNDRARGEYWATLKLVVQNIKKKDEQVEIVSPVAQKFQREFHPTFYPRVVASLATNLYQNVNKALETVADLSEVNLIYLLSQETITVPKKAEPITTGNSYASDPVDYDSKIRRELQMAELFIGKKQWTDALKELKAAEKKTAESATLHYLMGVVYMNQGSLTIARSSLQRALKIDPNHQEAKKMLTEVERKMAAPKQEEKKGWFGFGKKK